MKRSWQDGSVGKDISHQPDCLGSISTSQGRRRRLPSVYMLHGTQGGTHACTKHAYTHTIIINFFEKKRGEKKVKGGVILLNPQITDSSGLLKEWGDQIHHSVEGGRHCDREKWPRVVWKESNLKGAMSFNRQAWVPRWKVQSTASLSLASAVAEMIGMFLGLQRTVFSARHLDSKELSCLPSSYIIRLSKPVVPVNFK